ncbi:MAG: hypothetical protein ACQEP4_09040 [Bacillota bacterium]
MKKPMILFVLIGVFLIAGCSSDREDITEKVDVDKIKETANEIVSERLEETEQVKLLKEYYSFIENRMDEDTILNFLRDNVENLDEFRVDEMLLQLENHLYAKGYDTKGVLEKIAPHLQYASDEFKSYFRIWNREVENETTDGESLNIPVDEILERALDIENHIDKFPEGKTRARLEELYDTYMSLAIQGLGNQYVYAREGEVVLSESVLQAYMDVVNENPDSRTARILNNYLEELEKDEMELDGENALFFYDNIERIVENLD